MTLMIVGLLCTVLGFFTEKSYIQTVVSEDGNSLTFVHHNHHNGGNTPEEWEAFKAEMTAYCNDNLHVDLKEAGSAEDHGHGHDAHGHDTEHSGGEPVHAEEGHDAHSEGGGHGDHGHGHHLFG